MSFRNASARLRDVIIEGNTIHGWAGGGVFFNSVDLDDGSIAGGTYARVLMNILLPGRYRLEIEGGAVRDNHSRLVPAEVDDRRRGGGLYILRAVIPPQGGPGFGLPFDVTITDITTVAGNHLEAGHLPLAAPHSVELHVEDQLRRLNNPINDANMASFVTGTRFSYQSP
jgi:hypothetical protein